MDKPTDNVFEGSIPEIYDQVLVPLIFEPYALDLAELVASTNPRDVLETAAGTGVLTRALARGLPAQARIVVTDLNSPMLARAASRQSDDPRFTWQQADALALPFTDQSMDVVACQFGAMFFPDKVQGYSEAHRVLRPGGRFVFNVWDRIEENDFADTVTRSLATMFPADPPQFLARTPHGYYDIDRIRAELDAAGFADISIDFVDARSKAASPRDPAIGYCQGTPLRTEIEARDPSSLEAATRLAAEALAERFGNGAVDGRIRAIVITAVR